MRLIDADELKKDLSRFYDGEVTAKQLIDEQPIIYSWIDIKDRLPGKTDRYMCLCYDFVTKSYWHEILWYENNHWWNSLATLECDYTKHVVYWMLLPEPPKEVTPWME